MAEQEEPQGPSGAEWALILAVLALLAVGAAAVALARQVARLLRVRPQAAAAALAVIGYRPGNYQPGSMPAPQGTRTAPPPGTTQPTPPTPAARRGTPATLRITATDTRPGTPSTPSLETPPGQPRPAEDIAFDAERHYAAAFLANSSRRIDQAITAGTAAAQVARERRYWQAHQAAFTARLAAARDVDTAAAAHGPLLGWKAKLDKRTSPECRAAHGRNFRPDRPPNIGWPGSVHPRCRCQAVAPYPGAPLVDDRDGPPGFERRVADA